jgi:spermidine synthase
MRFYQEDLGQGIFTEGKLIKKKETPYQRILLFESPFFGKIMSIDEDFQFSEKEEFIYHEPLAHIPMNILPKAKKILIIGGGDGCLARELIKYKTIERIDLCDIDKAVVDFSKTYLNDINKGALNSKKVKIFIDDGLSFLKANSGPYDLVFLDLTDPVDKKSTKLYDTKTMLQFKRVLSDEGLIVMYSGAPILYPKLCREIQQNLNKAFPFKKVFLVYVPVFGTLASFSICSKSQIPSKNSQEIVVQLKKESLKNLKYYKGEVHNSLFVIPRFLEPVFE